MFATRLNAAIASAIRPGGYQLCYLPTSKSKLYGVSMFSNFLELGLATELNKRAGD